MSAYDPDGEMITRTFRVEKVWDEVLNEEAERQGISVSALLNLIVRRYVFVQRFFDRDQSLIVEYSILDPMLDKLSEETIVEAAKIAGSLLPGDAMLQRGLPLNFKSIVFFIGEMCGRYGNWYKCEHYVTDGENMFYLRHDIDRKWSVYISSYLSSMFKSILDIDTDPEIREDSVTIHIPNKYLKRAHDGGDTGIRSRYS